MTEEKGTYTTVEKRRQTAVDKARWQMLLTDVFINRCVGEISVIDANVLVVVAGCTDTWVKIVAGANLRGPKSAQIAAADEARRAFLVDGIQALGGVVTWPEPPDGEQHGPGGKLYKVVEDK